MSIFRKHIRTNHLVIAGHFLALIVGISTCTGIGNEDDPSGIVHSSGREFAGSESCAACHQSIAETHSHTPHYLTSRPADKSSVKGSFDSSQNLLVFSGRLKVAMEETQSGLFQKAIVDGVEVEKKPFDITIGSGRQGQTYLYWEDNALFQLPVSYYAPLHIWTNSPGYPPDQIVFNRNIPARCMECHSTYAKVGKTVGANETFDRNQIMLGVDCERCHGPAAQHVNFHRKYPGTKEAKHIVNPAKLSRQQKLDNCALCHSGIRDNIMPSFSYLVGESLDDYSFPATAADSAATLDVHGNQYGLLTSSKCFRLSEMDCSSCHNVHVQETNQAAVFSARCMNCHQRGTDRFCKQPELPGLVLSNNCIDCHMPELPSRQVFVQASENVKPTPFFVRTHLVGVYEKQIRSFLEKVGAGDPALK